jgi:threonylcarbamoyladenosine tRNA methylthiotransferase MtaB
MKKISSISVHTLGCKLNQAESEGLARELTGKGFTLITGNRADAFIINSCSVTHAADGKSRRLVRMLRSLNPGAVLAVTGCYAERAKQELIDCGADMVCGNREKKLLAGLLAARPPQKSSGAAVKQAGRVRSFIKIQDGCNKFCSYCIVPFVRPTLYSVDADTVVKEIRSRSVDGYKEIVLTGTEIGSYSSNGLELIDMIKLILRETSVARLHLSSLQPQEITGELLGLWQDGRLCHHFHIALQSGSDVVLKRMGRRYTTGIFRKAAEMVRAAVPDASVTTDIIVGFPGESQEEFKESYEFCLRMKFAALHIFPYSARPGTIAAQMPGKVSEKVKKQRSSIMLELAASSADEFARRFMGQTRAVLWEKEVRHSSGIYSGLTDNYIRTYTRSSHDIANTITKVRLIDHAGNSGPSFISESKRRKHGGLWGELLA